MKFREYYQSQSKLLELISYPKFRHFRFSLANGQFYKVPKRVISFQDLHYWILKKQPLDIYYSVALFRDPTRIGQKGADKAEFMGMDLAFDIDDPDDLDNALLYAKQILEYGDKSEWKLRYIAFSGSKGFHILYKDPFEYCTLEPEKEAMEYRKSLVEEMQDQSIEFDYKITVDTRRIIRLPYSIHPKTGYICQPIPHSLILNKSFKELKKYLPKVTKHRWPTFRSLFKGDDNFANAKWKLPKFRNRLKVRSELYFSSFLTNRIVGTKLFITIIQYSYFTTKQQQLLQEVSTTYNLGEFLVYKMDKYFAINLKPVAEKRLVKILKAAKSENLYQFEKHKVITMEIGPRETPERIPVMHLSQISKVGEKREMKVSRGHYQLLIGDNLDKYFVGKEGVEIKYRVIVLHE